MLQLLKNFQTSHLLKQEYGNEIGLLEFKLCMANKAEIDYMSCIIYPLYHKKSTATLFLEENRVKNEFRIFRIQIS